MSESELRREVLNLRARHATLLAVLRLIVVLMKVCELSLRHRRVPDDARKRLLLGAIERSKEVLGVRAALRVLGLSKTQYH